MTKPGSVWSQVWWWG